MLTPYDWQEGIGNRASYVENKLGQGLPVIAISLEEGILLYAFRRQARKIFEIYDQLAFAAIGQQSDVEALRIAALDFAHQEGFNRSERDVTLQRVVTALSSPIKKAFADFSSSPVVARSLFAEVGPTPEKDAYSILNYDGDYVRSHKFAVVAGSEELTESLTKKISDLKTTSADKAIADLKGIYEEAIREDNFETEGLTEEAVLLERSDEHVNRFRSLLGVVEE